MLRLSKFCAAAILAGLLLVPACASRDTRRNARDPFPDTPDPAGARRLAGDWVFAMKTADHEIDGKLHFSYDGAFLTGAFTDMAGTVRQLAEIRTSKDRMAWKLPDDRGAEQFIGSFGDDGTLSGAMTRVRKRDSQSSDDQGGDSGSGSDNPPAEQPQGGHGHGGGHHRGGGSHGGTRSSGSAKWSAVPAPKADAPGANGG
jgi:hypothetical protein